MGKVYRKLYSPESNPSCVLAHSAREMSEEFRKSITVEGDERQQDYASLAEILNDCSVEILVCLPVTGDRLATATYSSAPQIEVLEAEDLETAMRALSTRRSRFDAVMLSPGAPSYNQFRNFGERGDRFIALAHELFSE